MARRGHISEPEKKIIAASQQWRCNLCSCLLPPAYQIDHVVALVDGGIDAASNAQALCPNCHAEKTQREHVARLALSRCSAKAQAYADREDIYLSKTRVMCTLCKRERAAHANHDMCPAIEDPDHTARCVSARLCKFSFIPRNAQTNHAS